MLSINDAILGHYPPIRDFEDDVEMVIRRYMAFKKARNMMDFDDLLYYTLRLLHSNTKFQKMVSNRYRYVMCDEYQDTNIIQDELLKLICGKYGNLAVVGDDNQSIYRFRGANIGNILTFNKRYKGCTVIKLIENYRSTQQILDLSNSVMHHAEEGIQKDLHGQTEGVRPDFFLARDKEDEAREIVRRIKKSHNAGKPYKDTAILVRNAMQSAYVEKDLGCAGIPFIKYGGPGFFDQEHIHNLICYLRVLENSSDEIAWLRILKLYPGIGAVTAKNIAAEAADNGRDALVGLVYSKKSYYRYLEELYSLLNSLDEMDLQEKLYHLVWKDYPVTVMRLIDGSKSSAEKKEDMKEKLEKQMKAAGTTLFEISKNFKATTDFLDSIALAYQRKDEDGDHVVISTIHSAKGLEYDTVYLMEPVKGIFPRNSDNPEEDNEELRCLYVALTRARNTLSIFIPLEIHTNTGLTLAELSHHMTYDDVVECCDSNKDIYQVFPEEQCLTWDFR